MIGIIEWCIGAFVSMRGDIRQNQRGLSQSTENAILLAGAVTVAGIVITVITAYVKNRLPE